VWGWGLGLEDSVGSLFIVFLTLLAGGMVSGLQEGCSFGGVG